MERKRLYEEALCPTENEDEPHQRQRKDNELGVKNEPRGNQNVPPDSTGRTTLFVSGLPMDTKPRELYLLCRLMPGYERSVLQMKSPKHSPVGFVTFASRQQAENAKQTLEGVKFDPNDSRTIRIEFARKPTIESNSSTVSSTGLIAQPQLM